MTPFFGSAAVAGGSGCACCTAVTTVVTVGAGPRVLQLLPTRHVAVVRQTEPFGLCASVTVVVLDMSVFVAVVGDAVFGVFGRLSFVAILH